MAGKSKTARRPNNQAAEEAETVYNEAIQCTFEKTEVLEKLVRAVTMRADSLATTEADPFPDTP